MTWVGRGVCGVALLPATQGSVAAGTWPARPYIYNAEAGHQGRAEGQVATWLMWGQPCFLSERRKHFGAGFCGKIPEIPAKKIVK